MHLPQPPLPPRWGGAAAATSRAQGKGAARGQAASLPHSPVASATAPAPAMGWWAGGEAWAARRGRIHSSVTTNRHSTRAGEAWSCRTLGRGRPAAASFRSCGADRPSPSQPAWLPLPVRLHRRRLIPRHASPAHAHVSGSPRSGLQPLGLGACFGWLRLWADVCFHGRTGWLTMEACLPPPRPVLLHCSLCTPCTVYPMDYCTGTTARATFCIVFVFRNGVPCSIGSTARRSRRPTGGRFAR